jgi:glucose/arabinose dehydrogenase
MPIRRALPILIAIALLATGCQDDAPGSPAPSGSSSPPRTNRPAERVRVEVPASLADAPFDVPRHLSVPAGWSASVYARITKARFMSPTPNGELLVSQPSAGTVWLVRRGADGTGRASEFVSGLDRPHDIVFAEVSGRSWVFIAEAHRVMRYPYAKGDARAQPGEVVVDGLPTESTPELGGRYAHVLKNIAVRGQVLYLSIASTCNACVSDTVSDPQRAAIYTYDAAGRNAGRRIFAAGLRNAEGLAFVPGTRELWVVVNNRDNTLVPDDRDVDGDGASDKGKRMTEYVDDHPPEEFIHVRDGGFYGWPFCNPNIDKGLRNMPYDRDYELNADGQAADCSAATPVDVGIQAHSAPLGLTFTQDTAAPDLGAVIALHGSWNRSVPTGYKVIHFPWTDGKPGEQADLATGWLDPESGGAWGRPVDVAIDADGSLFVSDDLANAVIRLTPPRR